MHVLVPGSSQASRTGTIGCVPRPQCKARMNLLLTCQARFVLLFGLVLGVLLLPLSGIVCFFWRHDLVHLLGHFFMKGRPTKKKTHPPK